MKFFHRDEAFTLIELMIVILIIAILVAIAVPVFLSARKNAQRRTCQANLRTIEGAINTYNAEYDAYPPAASVESTMVPDLIKKNPTCPSAEATYMLTAGTGTNPPPNVACPGIAEYTDHVI